MYFDKKKNVLLNFLYSSSTLLMSAALLWEWLGATHSWRRGAGKNESVASGQVWGAVENTARRNGSNQFAVSMSVRVYSKVCICKYIMQTIISIMCHKTAMTTPLWISWAKHRRGSTVWQIASKYRCSYILVTNTYWKHAWFEPGWAQTPCLTPLIPLIVAEWKRWKIIRTCSLEKSFYSLVCIGAVAYIYMYI